jgi:hypothetical protein
MQYQLVCFRGAQVEYELQCIQRDKSAHKSRSLWTLQDDRELLNRYWRGISRQKIRIAKFGAENAARNRLNYIKLEISDTSYNTHQHVRQRVEFNRENAELYVDAACKCLLHINTLPETQWHPPRLSPSAPPSPPPLPPKPPCNHPEHVQLWNRGVLPCWKRPRSATGPNVPAVAVPNATARGVAGPVAPSITTDAVTPQKQNAWTAQEKDQIMQFSQIANNSVTPIKLCAQELPGRSAAEIRCARNRLKAEHPSKIAVGGFKRRALQLQARQLVKNQRSNCNQQTWRTLFLQKQARAELVAARRLSKGLKLFDTPFPQFRCDSTLPTQHLPYDDWLYLDKPSDSDLNLLGQGKTLPRAPLPNDAVVDWLSNRVRMPVEWAITLVPSSFILPEGLLPAATYALADVWSDTTIATLANDIKGWLDTRKELSAINFNDAAVQLHFVSDGGGIPLPPEWTVQRGDLYNERHRLIATRLPAGPDVNDLARQRLHAQQAAYNNRPEAPEHTAMLNNLLGERGNPAPTNSNLPGGRDYGHLETHLRAITAKCAHAHLEPVKPHKEAAETAQSLQPPKRPEPSNR